MDRKIPPEKRPPPLIGPGHSGNQPASGKRKDRKFFQQVQPSFIIESPTSVTSVQFIDSSDPNKNVSVRKKAREWVSRSKEAAGICRFVSSRLKQQGSGSSVENGNSKEREKGRDGLLEDLDIVVRAILGKVSPYQPMGISASDPFSIFPTVGRKYDHILQYCKSFS